jgi:hypothetical protein
LKLTHNVISNVKRTFPQQEVKTMRGNIILFIAIFTILPCICLAQRNGSKAMDFTNIDYRLLDSLIIVEINVVRDSLGNYNMHYSRVISDNISKPRCWILQKEQHVYHPDGRSELYTDKLESSVVKECSSKFRFKNGVNVVDGFEICLFNSRNYRLVTYRDYAKSIVDLWETSPDHCMVIRDAWGKETRSGHEFIITSGVSTKYGVWKGRNGFYAVLNLVVVYK